MSIREEGSNIIVDGSVAGSLFPKSERDIVFPILVDGSNAKGTILIEGSVFGKSIEMRGGVQINGPVVSRGDTKLSPSNLGIYLAGGITVNGLLNGTSAFKKNELSLIDDIKNASIIIRGDIAVNQSLFLNNAIVFGSIRAVNCNLQNCIVLGTVIVQEKLTISMSSIGGYAAREVYFEGSCIMLHALGESTIKPVFGPHEAINSEIYDADIRFYPAMREKSRMVNMSHKNIQYPEYSKLDEFTDWVAVTARQSIVIDDGSEEMIQKWVLSIGGRIGNFQVIQQSIDALADMLMCGFEYDHLNPLIKNKIKEKALQNLNDDEKWILEKICPSC